MKKYCIVLLLFFTSIFMTGCTKKGEVVDNSDKSKDTIVKQEADINCSDEITGQKSCPKAKEEIVVLETNYGTVKIKLFTKEAPKTTANFKKLVKEGFYDGLIFHRVISGFMIQGGDPEGTGMGGPDYTIPAEINSSLQHVAGAVATARLGDQVNPTKASSGSQFYIVHDDQGARGLDGDYTIFGQVISGQNIVNTIAEVETNTSDKPVKDVVIEKAYIEQYQK